MPLLRTLTTKLKTAISPSNSPSSSPASSPTSPVQTSSFEVVSGRKGNGAVVKRLDQYPRMDSFIMDHAASNASKENINTVQPQPEASPKQRRISKFREELDVGDQ